MKSTKSHYLNQIKSHQQARQKRYQEFSLVEQTKQLLLKQLNADPILHSGRFHDAVHKEPWTSAHRNCTNQAIAELVEEGLIPAGDDTSHT